MISEKELSTLYNQRLEIIAKKFYISEKIENSDCAFLQGLGIVLNFTEEKIDNDIVNAITKAGGILE